MLEQPIDDQDPIETQEWLDALESVAKNEGSERAKYLLAKLGEKASALGAAPTGGLTTPYCNSIRPQDETRMPGDPLADPLERDGDGDARQRQR